MQSKYLKYKKEYIFCVSDSKHNRIMLLPPDVFSRRDRDQKINNGIMFGTDFVKTDNVGRVSEDFTRSLFMRRLKTKIFINGVWYDIYKLDSRWDYNVCSYVFNKNLI